MATWIGIVCIVAGVGYLIASRLMSPSRNRTWILVGGPILIIVGTLLLTGAIEPSWAS